MLKVIPAIAGTFALVGCMNPGADLAELSGKYSICSLEKGPSCDVSPPPGTTVGKATLISPDDAILISSTVKTEFDCRSFASHAKSRSPHYVAQAAINNIVVLPYGEVIPNGYAVNSACKKAPYNLSLTVAKAP